MNDERRQILDKVLGRQARGLADLCLAWKAMLSPERLTVLRELEQRGFRLGVHFVPLAGDRWMAQFTASDARGGLQLLDAIEQATTPPAVN